MHGNAPDVVACEHLNLVLILFLAKDLDLGQRVFQFQSCIVLDLEPAQMDLPTHYPLLVTV